MEGSSLKRSPTTGPRCQEERVEMQPISKCTRSCVLKQMLEELRAVKKESMDAIEEIKEWTVKREADVEEELQGGLARHNLEREQIAVGCKKGKGKQQAPVIAAGHGRKTYHAAVYRASFQPSATRRSKSYSGSGKQNGKAAAVAMSNDGATMRREVKEKASISRTCGHGERRTREKKDHGTTNASRNGGVETYLEKVKGKEKVVGPSVEKSAMKQKDKAKVKFSRKKSTAETLAVKEQCWTIVVDNPLKLRNNVLHIPRDVIRACISGKIPRITLIDRNTDVPYYCKMTKRSDTVDRYLLGGWSDFCKERNLQKGDTLRFCIRYPPVDSILVTVERGKAE